MSENKICPICGGYIGNVIIRKLPAHAPDGTPYPEAPVPPINICPGHTPTATEPRLPHPFVHEYDPSKELVHIPAGTQVFPNTYFQQQETLWEIAQAVAERDSMYCDSNGFWRCPFCGENKHDNDCIVTKARQLMEWRKAQPRVEVKVKGYSFIDGNFSADLEITQGNEEVPRD